MPALFSFGWIKNDTITTGGSLSFGQNIVQNRNATKQNNANIIVGDGLLNTPIVVHTNADIDAFDQNTIDAQNFTGPQV